MRKSISKYFEEDLGAAFVNPRYCWGAVDERGRAFLRVWEEDYDPEQRRFLIWEPSWKPTHFASKERVSHIEAMEAGAAGFLVTVYGKKGVDGTTEKIDDYDNKKLYVVDRIERTDDQVFAFCSGKRDSWGIRTQ